MNGFQENGSPRTATPARQGAFSPYYLYRRGTLGPAALDGLTPVRTWTLLAEAERTRQRREELRGRLEDALHTAVPALPADRRRELLRLRRDIHNDRVPGVPDAARLLDPATRELLEEWLRQRAEGHRLQKEAEAALAAELDDGRRTLAAVAAGELFQRGLQLSDERTWRTVTEWAADPFSPRRKPSKRRRAENTLTSFAYRVALKPSPFASFTEIGAAPWTTDAAVVPVDGPRARPVQARLSAGLLSWMTYELRRLDRADELMQIRLNHSLLVQGEKAMCVRRAPDGAPEAAYGAAQVVAARDTGLLRLLRSLLADGARPEREVRDRLTAAGLSPEAAATALDKLVRAGICERGLGIPDQHPRPALAVAQRLRALDTEQAGRCAVVFEQLQAAEDAFPAAPVRRRADLLAGMREQVAVFTDTVGCPAPAPEALRSVVYEDVGTRRPARTWRPEVLHANRWALELFQRIVPVLDDATVEKAGLYAFFVRHFGEDADAVPFVEFYRRFAALPPAEASAVASGVGDPHADRIRALRARPRRPAPHTIPRPPRLRERPARRTAPGRRPVEGLRRTAARRDRPLAVHRLPRAVHHRTRTAVRRRQRRHHRARRVLLPLLRPAGTGRPARVEPHRGAARPHRPHHAPPVRHHGRPRPQLQSAPAAQPAGAGLPRLHRAHRRRHHPHPRRPGRPRRTGPPHPHPGQHPRRTAPGPRTAELPLPGRGSRAVPAAVRVRPPPAPTGADCGTSSTVPTPSRAAPPA
ncbi:hypothetical protein GCM10020256_30260 [Streptomyces thermocoprophilus]